MLPPMTPGDREPHSMQSALEYLANTSAAMANGYVADCVTHACAIADLLLRAHDSPSIARLRVIMRTGDRVFYAPLIPKRFTGAQAVTWNTHYVCCLRGAAYDPMLAQPVAIENYCQEAFGIAATLEEHLSPDTVATLWREGALRQAFRPNAT